MEDVSPLVGHVAVKVGGKDYILDNAGWDDWSVFKNSFIDEKRTRIIRAAVSCKGLIPQDEYLAIRSEALTKAGTITEIGNDDLRELMGSREGMAFMLWTMLERRYPQAVTRSECQDAINNRAVTEDQLVSLTNAMFTAMGMTLEEPGGNVPSQVTSAVEGVTG